MNANGKNGRKKSGRGKAKKRRPKWAGGLGSYRDLKRLVFDDEAEIEKAIDLLWTDELRDLPHGWPNSLSIAVPAEAVPYFSRAGLRFVAEKLVSVNDLSPNEIALARRS